MPDQTEHIEKTLKQLNEEENRRVLHPDEPEPELTVDQIVDRATS